MIRNITRFTPLLALAVMLVACGDDKEAKPKKRTLGFTAESLTFNEADGTVEVEVTLDKPATTDVSIDFSISGGTARDVATAESEGLPADYEIMNDDFEVQIDEGETTGIIEIDLWTDLFLEEEPETIVIKLEEPASGEVILGAQDEITINVEQEHGLVVFLSWDDEYTGEDDPDTVDMDLFLWVESEGEFSPFGGIPDPQYYFFGLLEAVQNGETGLFQTSIILSNTSPEWFFVPSSLLEDGNWGIGCTYYSGPAGKENPFEIEFLEIEEGGAVNELMSFSKTYTDANINKWDNGEPDLKYAVTFSKAGNEYEDFEYIENATGSRVPYSGTPGIYGGFKKSRVTPTLRMNGAWNKSK